MCLCLFAINAHEDYPFILLANRDEFRKRPSAKASFWQENNNVLAGRDLQQMGTWLGITKTGKIAFLTNHRHPKFFNRSAPSRGSLVSNFLSGNSAGHEYLNSLEQPEAYNGFNLITGSSKSLFYFSNVQQEVVAIEDGVHGLSNAFLNTSWPKTELGKTDLQNLINRDEFEENQLFSILEDSQLPPDNELPDTGVGLNLERVLAPRFINTLEYGTVCSTVVLIDKKNLCFFTERTFDAHGKLSDTVSFEFQIEDKFLSNSIKNQ